MRVSAGRVSIEEAKQMVGTEFTFVYSDGDEIHSYIKAFDPEIGLTCFTLETETRDGYKELEMSEKDGTWCIIGCDFSIERHKKEAYCKWLPQIKFSGKVVVTYERGYFNGCAF